MPHCMDEAVDLVRAAHVVCPYSNATRGNIEAALSANGRDVEEGSDAMAAGDSYDAER
jgi:hypothetical protein